MVVGAERLRVSLSGGGGGDVLGVLSALRDSLHPVEGGRPGGGRAGGQRPELERGAGRGDFLQTDRDRYYIIIL